jgi:muskelin
MSNATYSIGFWVYHISHGKWRCVYQNEHTDAMYWETMRFVEPRPRFAHQLVYDANHGRYYMFGGNPGDPDNARMRLADFWSLQLERPSGHDVLQRAKFLVRKQRCVAAVKVSLRILPQV